MQTRLSEKNINAIKDIVNDHDPRIQAAIRAIPNSNLLFRATDFALTNAVRDNQSDMNLLREAVQYNDGVIQTNGIVDTDVMYALRVIVENVEIQVEEAPQLQPNHVQRMYDRTASNSSNSQAHSR